MSKKEKYWFMDIKDKIKLSKTRCCPPHYMPHKLPFGDKVTDEPCHYHNSWLRRLHHNFFCKWLKCPNYEFMIKKYNGRKK